MFKQGGAPHTQDVAVARSLLAESWAIDDSQEANSFGMAYRLYGGHSDVGCPHELASPRD